MLRKTITLPAAVEENLQQALAYDLDRHTPFKPDELYFDAVVVGRDAAEEGDPRRLGGGAARRVVDQARAPRRELGRDASSPSRRTRRSDGPATSRRSRLNLLPDAERPGRRVVAPLAALGAARAARASSALVAIALPLWQKRDYAIALLQLADQARVAGRRRRARCAQQLERLTGDYNFALGKKYAFPERAAGARRRDQAAARRHLAHAVRGEERGRRARSRSARSLLRGESANAGRLVSLLEESKLFEQAAPRSPTTKIQPGPGRDLRPRRAAEAAAAAAPIAARERPADVAPPRRAAPASPAPAAAAPRRDGTPPPHARRGRRRAATAAGSAARRASGARAAPQQPPPAAVPRAAAADRTAAAAAAPRDLPPPPGSASPRLGGRGAAADVAGQPATAGAIPATAAARRSTKAQP